MNKINLYRTALYLVLCCVLMACNSTLQRKGNVATQVFWAGQPYQLESQQDLGSVVKSVYLPADKSKKVTHLELFQDLQQNFSQSDRYLQQRGNLRARAFQQAQLGNYSLNMSENQLTGFVLYPPSAQFDNYQLDVFSGKNIAGCGFVQWQYSQRFPVNYAVVEIIKNYPMILTELDKMDTAWRCND